MLAAAILVVVIARVRLLTAPLERDEGEHAFIGRLMLQGVPPYLLTGNQKLPGVHAANALIMALFGQTIAAIHFGLLLVNLGATVLLYWIGKELFDRSLPVRSISRAGLAASASYAVLSVGTGVLGLWAHATHFVVLFALGGTLLLLRWGRTRGSTTLFWSGLLYGVAFVMKQPGVFFAIFGALYVAWSSIRRRNGSASDSANGPIEEASGTGQRWRATLGNLALFAVSAALPIGLTCVLLWQAGVFDRFFYWVVTYAWQYGDVVTLSAGVSYLFATLQKVLADSWSLWLAAAAGLFTLWRTKVRRGSALFLSAFLILSMAAVCPGLYFREHYFVLMLPAIALLASAMVAPPVTKIANSEKEGWRVLPLWLIAGALVVSLAGQSKILFRMSPDQVSRAAYPSVPFVEAVAVGDYLRAHLGKDARIAVMGSEPEIYFYAQCRSVTSYIYVYPLMDPRPFFASMQEEFIHDVESAAPEYMVLVNNGYSWLQQPQSSTRVFVWFAAYYPQHYEQVGLAEMFPGHTDYLWDAAATSAVPKSRSFVAVYERKAGKVL